MNEANKISPAAKDRTLERTTREAAGYRYRFERLTLPIIMNDMRFRSDDPGPGDRVPAFDLPLVGGGRFRSGDLARTGATLLIFGSSTCPMTDSAAPGLSELHRRFGHRVRFVMVNVREAHPGQTLPQPADINAKMAHAKLLRSLHDLEFEVAVDDLDGTLHRALGEKPNAAYILGANGTILFRAHWANNTKALAAALNDLLIRGSPFPTQIGGLIGPMRHMIRHIAPVLDRAGRGAWSDLWRVLPPLAVIATAMRWLRRHG